MDETVIKAIDLKKWFSIRMGFFSSLISRRQLLVKAVDGISFDIQRGEIYGLVGESGSGKTTTGRLVLRLVDPTDGKIYFKDQEITKIPDRKMKPLRRKMQMIFQDPYESLNPRMTILDIIEEPLRVQGIGSPTERLEKVKQLLTDVQLIPPEEFLYRFPHELSGGQRQRVASARTFTLDPELIVADEPVSMLDVSTRAETLGLILGLVKKFNTSFLYITHDLALARYICDRIAVMYLGKIMEKGFAEDVIMDPLHPYTKALIAAVPVPDPTSSRTEVVIQGEIPSPINMPSGCRFHTRCPYVMDVCRKEEPILKEIKSKHSAACHLFAK